MISFIYPILLCLLVLSAAHPTAHTPLVPVAPPSEAADVTVYESLNQTRGAAASHINYSNSDGLGSHGRSKRGIPADEAVAAWDKYGICSPIEYWQPTPEAMKESEAQDFMLKWLEDYADGKVQCAAEQFTAMRCFASSWWGEFDFWCPLDNPAQCVAPKPREIMRWIQAQHEDWPTSQLVDTARKVYFVYKTFIISMSDLKSDLDAVKIAEAFVALEARSIVKSFSPGYVKTRDAQCQFVKTMAQLAVDILIQVGLVALNQGAYSEALAEMASAAQVFAHAAKVANDNKALMRLSIKAAQKAHLAKNSLYYTQAAVGLGRKGVQAVDDVRNAHYVDRGSKVPSRDGPPRLEYPLIKAHGMCGNLWGVIDDTSAAQTDQLIEFISMHMLAIGYSIEELFNSIFFKDNEELGELALIGIMKFDGWTGRSIRSYEYSAQRIKRAIFNAMVSELLASSRQYIKCEERDDAQEVCKEDENLPPRSRVGLFCPPAYPRLRCQAGFWTKKQAFNWEKPLAGLDGQDSFTKYEMDLDRLYSNSIERYYTMGTDSYTPRGLLAGGQIAEPSDMGYLPVAVSKVRTVYPSRMRHHFPFSCGNWASNCTTSFINRINVNLGDEFGLRHSELLTHMQGIPEPANRFLLLCNLGVRWPNGRDILRGLHMSDACTVCDKVKEEIADKDELEGNYRFCNLDVVKQNLFKHELSIQFTVLGTNLCHKSLCERWLAVNSIELQKHPWYSVQLGA